MSKIIVNTGTLWAGGAERVLSILSKPFADAFEDVYYVMWLDNKYPDIFYDIDERVKVIRVSQESGSIGLWRQLLWYRKYVKNEKPDLVLSFMTSIILIVTLSLFGLKIPQIVAERNDPRYTSNKWIRQIINMLYFMPSIKGIIMQSEWNKSYFSNKFLLRKTSIIPNPIEMSADLVGTARLSNKNNVVVSVGRLTDQKQHTTLLKAFELFHKHHPDYSLIIYGDGKNRELLEREADNLGLRGCINLPGRVSNVLSHILSARMFVMTSKYEGMSNALVEAMSVGLPCISTKVSGATDLIKDGENGYLVDVGDVYTISEKMCVIAENESLRNTLAANASLVYRKLEKNTIGNQWVDYLKKNS